MFKTPTLRGEGFFLALSSVGLAVLIAITAGPLPVPPLALGAVFGMASGVTHELAISRLPRHLTNAIDDLPARRHAFLASPVGKLHAGIDGLVLLLLCAGIFWQPHQPPLPAFAAYWVVRSAIGLISLLTMAHRRRP